MILTDDIPQHNASSSLSLCPCMDELPFFTPASLRPSSSSFSPLFLHEWTSHTPVFPPLLPLYSCTSSYPSSFYNGLPPSTPHRLFLLSSFFPYFFPPSLSFSYSLSSSFLFSFLLSFSSLLLSILLLYLSLHCILFSLYTFLLPTSFLPCRPPSFDPPYSSNHLLLFFLLTSLFSYFLPNLRASYFFFSSLGHPSFPPQFPSSGRAVSHHTVTSSSSSSSPPQLSGSPLFQAKAAVRCHSSALRRKLQEEKTCQDQLWGGAR